jgi:hypothetical protein
LYTKKKIFLLISNGRFEHLPQFLPGDQFGLAIEFASAPISPPTARAAAQQPYRDKRQQREMHDGHGGSVPRLKSSIHFHLTPCNVFRRGDPVAGFDTGHFVTYFLWWLIFPYRALKVKRSKRSGYQNVVSQPHRRRHQIWGGVRHQGPHF